MKIVKYSAFAFVLLAIQNCKEPYNIPVQSANQSFLVVEGNINCGDGPTTIHLSRTFKLSDYPEVLNEQNAQVLVEGNDNTSYTLYESSPGVYSTPNPGFVPGRQYRLHIRTSSGKQYLSDFVTGIHTPPIDSVNWMKNANGVTIYVNTHDATKDTGYYKWDYEETWEIHSAYFSQFKDSNYNVVPRIFPQDEVDICYKYRNSSNILLANTATTSANLVYRFPLTTIPYGAEELFVRYSILVNQYSLSKEAYQYYGILKKNTESLGSLFDPQPSEQQSNIHSVSDASEQVIGYLTASEQRQQRIFINNDPTLAWTFLMDCSAQKFIDNNKDSLRIYLASWSVYSYKTGAFGRILGYYAATPYCVDCTTRGGSNIKPSYW